MFQYLFFCCQENQKDQPNTVTLEDVISQNQKNNLNFTTQANNNQNNIEESFINNSKEAENKFYPNGVLLNNKGLFVNENSLYNSTNPTTPILTINNINNININLQRNSFSKEPTKLLEKKDSQSNDTPNNNINDLIKQKTIISGENSKDQYQSKSFISFSNLTIKYNNNNNIGGSSINFSDTEIMSSCELTLIGDLFFNKEIKVDRSGIKNPLITNTNRFKNKNKKACELKLGVVSNNIKGSSSNLIGKNLDDKNNINNNINNINNKNSMQNLNFNNNKNNKLITIKSNQKKKIQSMCSITSLTNSMMNKNNIDILLNLSYTKLQKKICENSNNYNNNENIVLFILKYDTTLDMFQLTSMQDSVPVELLLNYNYPLRFQQNYNILIGSIKLKIKVIKNEKNESILNISYFNIDENNDNNNKDNKKEEEKKEIIFKFNPFIDKMPITIGRINCDINLNNISVSKLHTQIDYIYDYDEYFITDCKSTNGTYLLLKNTLNSIFIKRELHFKLFESKFKIHYLNFDN